ALRIEDESDPRDARRGLLERLQPFGSDRELEAREAGDIATRMRQVRYQSLADGIDHLRKHDWHSLALLPQRDRYRRAVGQDQVGSDGEQLRRVVAQYSSVPGPTIFDREIAAVDPSQLPQAVFERQQARLSLGVAGDKTHQHADPSHVLRLRTRGKRPSGDNTADERNELAPLHLITSSARASTECGISSPS